MAIVFRRERFACELLDPRSGFEPVHAEVEVRVVARTYFAPLQRSDVVWSERLHGELATDIRPEKLADLARRLSGLDSTAASKEVSVRALPEDPGRDRR